MFEVQRRFGNQIFLESMYKVLFALSCYGMMRVGELTQSDHVVKACNVHSALNKKKLMLMLYTSKTHGVSKYPQKIKIRANEENLENNNYYQNRYFCPFKLTNDYMRI